METKQHRSPISREVLLGLGFLIILTMPVRAQYTADFQTNIISGVTSNWSGSYIVGSNTFADVLSIRSGGSLRNNFACAGFEANSSNNSISVDGPGSFWNNGDLYIGYSGAGNSLVISNTAGVIEHYSTYLGFHSGSDSNSAYVTDPGSDLTSALGSTYVGYSGSANSLVISNAGRVRNSASGYLGYNASSSSNVVLITNSGSVWYSFGNLYVGYFGSVNQLTIGSGGSVVANNAYIGYNPGSTGNRIDVAGGSLYVTNATHHAVLDVRCGTLTFSSGELQADVLIVTNPCGHFTYSSTPPIIGSIFLDPMLDADGDGLPNGYEQGNGFDPLMAGDADADSDGDGMSNLQEYLAGTDPTNSASAFRITGIVREGDNVRVTWMMGAGKTNALQAAAAGGYDTNMFADIFTVTNTIDNITNYLDVGGATNEPARFYRVRLVP